MLFKRKHTETKAQAPLTFHEKAEQQYRQQLAFEEETRRRETERQRRSKIQDEQRRRYTAPKFAALKEIADWAKANCRHINTSRDHVLELSEGDGFTQTLKLDKQGVWSVQESYDNYSYGTPAETELLHADKGRHQLLVENLSMDEVAKALGRFCAQHKLELPAIDYQEVAPPPEYSPYRGL